VSAPEILWRPSAERIERATITRYERWLREKHGRAFAGYAEMWKWSVTELDGFWRSICEFCDVRFSNPPAEVLARREMPGAECSSEPS